MGWRYHHALEGLEEEEKPRLPSRVILLSLLGFLKPYKLRVAGLAFATFSRIIVTLLMPLVTKEIIDSLLRGSVQTLALYSMAFLGVAGFDMALGFARSYLSSWIGQSMIRDIRSRMYAHLLRLRQAFFSGEETGKTVSKITNDVDTIGEAFTSGVIDTLSDVLTLAGAIAIMFGLNLELSLVVMSLIPLILASNMYFARRAREAFRLTRKKIAKITSRIEQEVSGAKVVQAFSYRRRENIREFSQMNQENLQANVQATRILSTISPVLNVIRALGAALVIWYGSILVSRGALTIGTLVAFYGYVEMFFRPVQTLTLFYNTIQSTLAAADRVVEFLREEEEKFDAPIKEPPKHGRVEFENVVFGYEEGLPVIRGVSFTASPGEKVAIVGPTGSGKTTLANLLLRFYEPWEGSIKVDGHDVREYDLRALRRGIAFVPQGPIIFSGTVLDNIRVANPTISREEVEWIVEFLGLKDIIDALPDGLDTKLMEGGKNVSMGQRQVISLIRAFVSKPKIIILDEATSSLDIFTEARLQDAMDRISRDKTLIVIAHRLSTVENADKIVVMHDGRKVEEGTHRELLSRGGVYAKIYRSQIALKEPSQRT